MSWKAYYTKKLIPIEEAARQVKSGDTVVTGLAVGACSAEMYNAILDRHAELRDVKISDTVQVRPSKLYDPEFMANLDGHINYMPGFGIATNRKMSSTKLADFYPCTTLDLLTR